MKKVNPRSVKHRHYADLDVLNAISERGAAAIERGEYILVSGEEGRRALFERLDRRAAERAKTRRD
ncbi:hypothetical protein [Azospirillum sp. SYSU D00513]|uniref:hypothetical protein n=1 Tax=Azospirillum sp. SYSU D00513 TaxID=2812561 RepID=UPI001A95AA40|nr:hypothetical protein [Azospirillum sp. SYSU D00513]